MVLYCLNEAVRFVPPVAWSIQVRCAVAHRGEAFTAPAGTLVIHKGVEGSPGALHTYRLAGDARVGVLDIPPDDRFRPVDDEQMVGMAGQIKDLPELLREKGLRVESLSRLEPFTVIRCPMCAGTEFVTVDLASVWCDVCNTRFETRTTAGDPGVVIDAHMDHYAPWYAHYIVPRSLTATLVIKDFGYSSHPDGVCGDYCVNGDKEVSSPSGLRSSTEPCGLEVYDWSLYGRPELGNSYRQPRPLYVRGQRLDVHERVYALKSVHSRLPSVSLLADGVGDPAKRERWHLIFDPPAASPVWWKVRPLVEEALHGGMSLTGWDVVDRSLCPQCLQPASARDHRYCNWAKLGWKPPEGLLEERED